MQGTGVHGLISMHTLTIVCSSLRWTPNDGLAWSPYKCSASGRAVYGVFVTERPLDTIRNE